MDLRLNQVRREPHLHGVTVRIPEGITEIDGPDVMARATLMRVLALIQRPDSGEILFNGKRFLSTRYRRMCGFLPNMHSQGVSSGARVEDALRYFAGLWMVPEPKLASEREIDRWGLESVRTVPISRLSFGQQKRFALAVSLIMEPAIWIAEAPFAGLDHPGRVVLEDVLWHRTTDGSITVMTQLDDEGRIWPSATRFNAVNGTVMGTSA